MATDMQTAAEVHAIETQLRNYQAACLDMAFHADEIGCPRQAQQLRNDAAAYGDQLRALADPWWAVQQLLQRDATPDGWKTL